MAIFLLGSPIAKRMLKEVRQKALNKGLCLAIVQVGKNAASVSYLKEKQLACEKTGIRFRLTQFSQNTSQEKLKQEIKKLSQSPLVHGIVVQLPLPPSIDAQEICDEIPMEKDPDVLSSISFGLFALGKFPILPPTVGAVQALFLTHQISLKEKRILLVGAGRLVGLPLATWLLAEKANFAIARRGTKDLTTLARKSDIIISGAGVRNLITGSMLKKGAIVVDAGTSVEEGVTKGDVDIMSVSKKAAFVAPVPGGMGPLTVACLLRNITILHEHF